MQTPTLVVTTFAIGKTYVDELKGWVQSIRNNSGPVLMKIGIGRTLDNVINVHEMHSSESTIRRSFDCQIPIDRDLIDGWNNIGFLKPFWILSQMLIVEHGSTILWIDADARTRKDLNRIVTDLRDADVGLCRDKESWIAGTIAIHVNEASINFFKRWSLRCLENIKPNQTDWTLNDQTIMRKLIENEQFASFIQLDKIWACIAPNLAGEFDPRYDKFDEQAAIWHWQASRKVKYGIDWPPSEEVRNSV